MNINKLIYNFLIDPKNVFYGIFLQNITINRTTLLPTAAALFNKKTGSFSIELNYDFMTKLSDREQMGVLLHEVMHLTNNHIFRFQKLNGEQKLKNIAADLSINQFISDLPEGCVTLEQFKLEDGSPFPAHQTMEYYYKLFEQTQDTSNKEELEKYKEFDHHGDWEDLPEELKQKYLEELKEILKRSIEKTEHSYSEVPNSVKDFLEDIDSVIRKLSYKQILQNTIKKTLSLYDREKTWTKPNKRYGVYAPGTKAGRIPQIAVFIDTSGSISHRELNEFLAVVDGFLKHGSKTCYLGLFHTDLYSFKKFKRHGSLSDVESGGTELTEVLNKINKLNIDLSIILTDGYFDDPGIKVEDEVLWVISKEGTVKHPLSRIGKTIRME